MACGAPKKDTQPRSGPCALSRKEGGNLHIGGQRLALSGKALSFGRGEPEVDEHVKALLARMTLEEKVGLAGEFQVEG